MRKLFATLAACSLATGCGTGPDNPTIASYQFFLSAFASDTTAERVRNYDCIVTGNFTVTIPVASSGTVHFPIHITRTLGEQRGTHLEHTMADSTITDAVLVYTGLGEASVSFTLTAGPYTVTPSPGAHIPATAEYAGDWSCGPELPLSQDSTLNSYGYDSGLVIPGTWRISENVPIG
jgi:hypothetical protein